MVIKARDWREEDSFLERRVLTANKHLRETGCATDWNACGLNLTPFL